MAAQEILDTIPQRKPFLFVDKIIGRKEKAIATQYQVTGEEDFFKGHFPGNPIMPGVILQEALLQSGALLLGKGSGLGVVTRVSDGKFKSLVRPGDLLEMEVELSDQLGDTYYMLGKSRVGAKVVVILRFSVTLLKDVH